MTVILKPFIILYEIIFYYPLMIVVTALTAIFTTFFSSLRLSPTGKALPARIWSRIACYFAFIYVTTEGLEQIDKKKSYIFVANHQSLFDIFVIYGWLKNPFSWIMKKELRKIPLVGKACEDVGHIFIDRSHPVAAKKSIALAEEKLSNGNCVVIFPEGTRSHDGNVGTFKRGAFSIAADINLPIVPITIDGAYKRMSRKSFFIMPGRIKLIIHKPIENTTILNEQEIRTLANKVREIVVSGFQQNKNS